MAIGTPPSPGRRYFTPATSEPNSRDHSPAFAVWAGPWWPSESATSYHASTGLGPGRWGLLVDPGSWGNLVGGDFLRQVAAHAIREGQPVAQKKRDQPLTVGGVGAGTQQCLWNGQLPTALRRADGTYSLSTFTAPVIENSSCPALLGQQSLEQHRAILDCHNKVLYLCAPGEVEIKVPEGSEKLPLIQAPSGHLILPISDYRAATASLADSNRAQRHLLVDPNQERAFDDER